MSEQVMTASSDSLIADLTRYVTTVAACEQPVQLTPFAEGCHSEMYLCQKIGAVGTSALPPTFLVRYPKGAAGAAMLETCTESQQAELADTASPQVLHLGRLSCGTPIALEQYIDGTAVSFSQLTAAQITRLAGMVQQIHGRTNDRFSPTAGSRPTEIGTYADYIRATVQESVVGRLQQLPMQQYLEAEHLLRRGLTHFDAKLCQQATAFNGTTFSRLHHDLNQNNVLWRGDEPVPIDWNLTYGDPADDIDYLCTDNQVSATFRQHFVAAYRPTPAMGDVAGRLPLYTLKNRLDDLAWAMTMREADTIRYDAAYTQRLDALRTHLTNID